LVSAEEAVLGTILLAGKIPTACVDRGLKPEHFLNPKHAAFFEAALTLADEGRAIDALTLKRCNVDPVLVDMAAAGVPNVAAIDTYVSEVLTDAMWDSRRRAGLLIGDSVARRDEDLYARAERALATPQRATALFSKERLQNELWDLLEAGEVETFPWPFARLNELSPMKRGQVTIVGGWTSNGKTAWVDQVSRVLNQGGFTVKAWINEMTPIERAQRNVAAISGIDLSKITRGRLEKGEYSRYADALQKLPYDTIDATGWTAEEISRDIRQRRPDVAIVDILHLIPYRDERDLAQISQVFNACSKQADCHLLATAHLNERFVVGAARPQPHLGTLKGASSLKQDADNVMFVWREDDPDTGLPTDQGQIYFAKARQGQVGGLAVLFDGEHQTFVEDAWM
jgi:replicative DNA helicase